ncbi:MAG: S8 family serine peptidase [Acidobacteriota bacterium]
MNISSHRPTSSPNLQRALAGACATLVGLLLAVAPSQATDFSTQSLTYLAAELAADGIAPEDFVERVQPELLERLEADAEDAYFKSAPNGPMHSIVVSLKRAHTKADRSAQLQSMAGRAAIQEHVRAAQDRVLGSLAGKSLRGFEVRNRYTTLSGFSARADFRAVAALALHPDVERVEEMPELEQQLDPEAAQLTQADVVHQMGFRGNGVTVAVIDSGIDYKHVWFLGNPLSTLPTPKVLGGYDFGDDDADPLIDCAQDTHGTATAGIVASPLWGVAPNASLVHLKVQSASKCGKSSLNGDIPGALDWVVTNQATYGIRVISMSLGSSTQYSSSCGSGGWKAYRDALDDAYDAGITVFAASGNDANKNGMSFPACYPSVVSVGAVYDQDYPNSRWTSYNDDGSVLCQDSRPDADEVTCYSNSASFLDLLAPSNCAWTLAPNQGMDSCFSGTSAATPYAAGVAALLLEKNSTLTPDQLRAFLQIFGDPVTDPDNGITTRRVHAFRAWAFTPPPMPQP